jgi:hypothetical protein
LSFDEQEYTRDRFIKTNLAIENHAKDGSALEGCTCLQGKHFYELEEYSEEGITIAKREKEQEFYRKVAPLARQLRKEVIDQTFEFPKEIAIEEPKAPKKHFVHLNPHGRLYLPHGLTEYEKAHPEIQHTLAHCIKEIEEKEGCRPPYEGCPVNPVAICRASVEGSFKPRNVMDITTIDYPKDMGKEPAISEISLHTGKIQVHLNPKLKDNSTLEKAVLDHELREGSCIYNTTIDCHNEAVKHEPKGTRQAIHKLLG